MAATTHLWAEVQAWLDVLPYPPSQAKLAKRLGVTSNAVSEWKLGHSKPTPANLAALADEMEPVAGHDIHERLRQAVLLDQGYEPRRRKTG